MSEHGVLFGLTTMVFVPVHRMNVVAGYHVDLRLFRCRMDTINNGEKASRGREKEIILFATIQNYLFD